MRKSDVGRVPRIAFGIVILAGLSLLVLYWTGGQPQLEGLLWFYVLAGMGTGIIVSAHTFLATGISEEERHRLASTDEQLAATRDAFYGDEPHRKERRAVLKMLSGALAAIAAVVVFPIRSLGPSPGKDLVSTPFKKGSRLVTAFGDPIRVDQLVLGEVITVFPEGHTTAADAPTLLIRVEEERFQAWPGRETWTVDGLVAYSKICTHAACAVGLYQKDAGLLLCPCHQSTFDVLDGCKPAFGPATRALPQLPISVDGDGFLVAQSDYTEPIGPGYWDRERA